MATVGEHEYSHACRETAERGIKFVVNQFAIVKTPGLVEPVRLKIVAGVWHLTAMPRISEEKNIISLQFFRGPLQIAQNPVARCAFGQSKPGGEPMFSRDRLHIFGVEFASRKLARPAAVLLRINGIQTDVQRYS